ncbi:MAG: hypothetical protein KAT58_00715 [candidate division Zixibacteria bacterium]|nr:hypothetical protein [candidate division Zixibacteria bacterium]
MTLGAAFTLFTLSFLYKDNPLYKIAEHTVVGVSAGYFLVILYYNGLRPNLLNHLFVPETWTPKFDELWYLVPLFLGMAMWTRFSRKWAWVSRYPIACYFGIATGVAIPNEMKNRVVEQINGTVLRVGFEFSQSGFLGVPQGIWDIVLVILVLASLVYFFFSKEHKGWFGGIAKVGIYTLMIGFGASFGYTVMARVSLFIQRMQYLRDWLDMI